MNAVGYAAVTDALDDAEQVRRLVEATLREVCAPLALARLA